MKLSAFKYCRSLKSVAIGKKVSKIESYAFYGSRYKIRNVRIHSTVLKSVGKKVFTQSSKKAVIRVPSSKLKAYKKLLKEKGISRITK